MTTLKGKTIIITGASRGIGAAMAERFAVDGANIAIIAKTGAPNPKLKGTIHTVAETVESLGGTAMPIQCDLRDEVALQAGINEVAEHFGGIDILINNASALNMTPTLKTPMKRFDLMFGVNVRGTFAACQATLPHLLEADNPHILNVSPPLNLNPKWFKDSLVYTMSKYGMSMCTLGLAEEFKDQNLAVNSLWPKTTIATAAIEVNFPEKMYAASRKPSIMADAAYYIVTQEALSFTGRFVTDEDVLREAGVTDFDQYAQDPNLPTIPDFYLDDESAA